MLHTILLTNLQTDNLTEYLINKKGKKKHLMRLPLNGHNLDEKTYRYIELTERHSELKKQLPHSTYIK